ncbi:hypothetical protein N1495_09230 [Streptococcus didelphis]|uniref:Uncharacterized protein n=1 Tax=Streptococcus didelphis TaxID=102886 RepID=A0ABY9LF75_9STRE|nr:hypothetical protein [Streptococcus didelphis]WMB27562.1 hypothetical protein N1496_04970 [Streptococcus didelphis]WMB29455.1 hypothetical protein N1495_09230 [Streptococcus didelphis]
MNTVIIQHVPFEKPGLLSNIDCQIIEVYKDQATFPSVEFHLFPGRFHEFEEIVPDVEVSRRSMKLSIDALKRGLS